MAKSWIARLSIVALLFPGSARGDWALENKLDPLTDQASTTAYSVYQEAGTAKASVIRCTGRLLTSFIEFGAFLSNSVVPVRYRVDKGPLLSGRWVVSSSGTAAFVDQPADFARRLLNAEQLIIEAQDYRGQLYRAQFDLRNATSNIVTVLKTCHLGVTALNDTVKGLRHEIAIEIEKWGPKRIAITKEILKALGFYTGSIGPVAEPEFELSVQRLFDDYKARCLAFEIDGTNCLFVRPPAPDGGESHVSGMILEMAPPPLNGKFGKLMIND